MTTAGLELPVDDRLGPDLVCLQPEQVLEACRGQLVDVDERRRNAWRHARVLDALYHPGRYARIAYGFTSEPTVSDQRVWPEGDIVYIRAPMRPRMSARGSILSLDGRKVELYRFPRDRRLGGIRKFAGAASAAGMWQDWIHENGSGERLDPGSVQRTLLRYVPEQKWVARLRAKVAGNPSARTARRKIVVRVMSREVCGETVRRHATMRDLSKTNHREFRTPQVVGAEPRIGSMALRWVGGQSLLDLMSDQADPVPLGQLIGGLRSFHACPLPGLPRLSPERQRTDVCQAVADLSMAEPAERDRLVVLMRALEGRWPRRESGRAVTLHNDLHPAQLRWDADRFVFLDLERMALGDPLVDVANLAMQIRAAGFRPELGVPPGTADRWASALVESWNRRSDRAIDPERFSCYAACALLRLARGMMRHLRPGWRILARRCLELAESQVSGREVAAS